MIINNFSQKYFFYPFETFDLHSRRKLYQDSILPTDMVLMFETLDLCFLRSLFRNLLCFRQKTRHYHKRSEGTITLVQPC